MRRFPSKANGSVAKTDDERTRFARDLRDHRRGARTGPATEAGANKNHSRVRERLPDFIRGFDGGIVTELPDRRRRRVRA